MKQDFDFNKVGKKMPYTVPDDFFDTFEENIIGKTVEKNGKTPNRKHIARWIFTAVTTAAAVFALVLLVNKNITGGNIDSDSFAEVENAFCQLNTDDQEYLLEIYESDIFINE